MLRLPWLRQAIVLVRRAFGEFRADHCPQAAAAMSYHVLFSLFPLAILIVGVVGLVTQDSHARDTVVAAVLNVVPLRGHGRQQLRGLVGSVGGGAGALGLLGLTGVIWSASGVMAAVRTALNVAWDTEASRPFFRGKIVDLALVGGVFLVAGATVGLTVAAGIIRHGATHLPSALRGLEPLAGAGAWLAVVVASIALLFVIFAILYRVVPAVPTRLSGIWPGALVAAAGFEGLQYGFSAYLSFFGHYNKVYGTLGAVVAFMFFVYLASMVFLFGAEIASEYPRLHAEPSPGRSPAGPGAIFIAVRHKLSPAGKLYLMTAIARRITPGFLAEMFSSGNRFIAGIAVLAALGGFLFGYDTGVVGGAAPYIKKSMGIGAFGESWIVGSLLLGAIVGAFLAGKLADLLSRKWTKFAAGIVYTAAALGSAVAPTIETLCAARFVLGIAVGTASFVAPMYISEHSPGRLRGGMTAFNQLMVTFGILVAYLADFALSGFPHNWRWMFGFGAVPAICLAVAMALVPHTPRWLVQQGREDEARSVLRRSRASDEEIDAEIGGIRDAAGSQRKFRLRDLAGPRLRKLVIIGVAMAIFQQVLGINTVIYFGATILQFAGLSISTSVAQAVFLGIINFAGAAMAMLVLDRMGRRVPMIAGTAGCVIGLIGLGWFFRQPVPFQHAHAMIALAFIMWYLASFELSLGPVFWVMIAEIYPLAARAKAMALATMVNWTFNFLVSYFFLQLTMAIGQAGTFWLYAGFGVAAVAFFWRWLPETKGRTLEEIEQQVS